MRGPISGADGPEWAVIGIGNPGGEYARTRHNLGWDVLDFLADERGLVFETWEGAAHLGKIATGDEGRFALVKPSTYVNETGRMVQALCDRHGLAANRFLVVCDDMHLDLGRVRVRGSGSSGGHKGLKSVERALGTRDYPRLRIGIGGGRDAVDHVLGRFSDRDREVVDVSVAEAADVVWKWIQGSGLARLMNETNGE